MVKLCCPLGCNVRSWASTYHGSGNNSSLGDGDAAAAASGGKMAP